MNNKPWAYVSSAWSSNKGQAKKSARKYCRQLYIAGYTPICPLLELQDFLDMTVADERKDFQDMAEDLLRRSRILVLCGNGVDETVLNDIAIANRFHIASSTLEGIQSVEKKNSKGSDVDGE